MNHKHGERWAGRIREVLGDYERTHGYDDGVEVREVTPNSSSLTAVNEVTPSSEIPKIDKPQFFDVPDGADEQKMVDGRYFRLPKVTPPESRNRYFVIPPTDKEDNS